MSRLNATIKLVVMMGECFFLVFSGIFLAVSGMVLSGKVVAFDFPAAKEMAYIVFAFSLAVLLCTCYGCCGAVYQVQRKGCCPGRTVLALHQLLLISILLLSSRESSKLGKRAKSIKLVMENITNFPGYDKFERDVSEYFNGAYFDGNCADDPSEAWILEWVERKCPATMSQSVCALSRKKKRACDTVCPFEQWNATYCCPDQDLCGRGSKEEGDKGDREACPYDQCRLPVLRALHSRMRPTSRLLNFIALLSVVMIVFTCLLICYNPRDEIEIELLKTGVMTEEDIATIRRLKSQRKFNFNKKASRRATIDMDSIRNESERNVNAGESKPLVRAARHSRVSPTSPALSEDEASV